MRWILKWKVVDGKRVIKARLVVRGFMDGQGFGVDTNSATASRAEQRFVISIIVLRGLRPTFYSLRV